MKTCPRIIALSLSLVAGADFALAQSLPKFTHNPGANVLVDQYEAAIAREREKASVKTAQIESLLANKLHKLRDTLTAELQKLQENETKAGNLDSAVEIRDVMAQLQKPVKEPVQKPLTPAELRAKLVGTVWQHPPTTGVLPSRHWMRFNADGTITAGWHVEPSMWAVLPDNSVQAICTVNRFLLVMNPNADLTSLTTVQGSEIRRRK